MQARRYFFCNPGARRLPIYDEEDNFREIAGDGARERDGGEEEVPNPSSPRVAAAIGGGRHDAGPGALDPAAERDAQARAGSPGEWRQGPSDSGRGVSTLSLKTRNRVPPHREGRVTPPMGTVRTVMIVPAPGPRRPMRREL